MIGYSKKNQLHRPRNHPHRKKRNKRSLATEITKNVRHEVLMRDNGRCIYCGSMHNLQVHHFKPRSIGGVGIKENLVTLCVNCHQHAHNDRAEYMDNYVKKYLDKHYKDYKDEDRIYNKFKRSDKE